MDMRKMGILICLATLACGGKTHHDVPFITSFSPTQAKVGSNVVISGGNFNSTWNVSFGGIPAASFHVDGDNQISAIVPPNAISYLIELTNAAGVAGSHTRFIVMPVVGSYAVVSDPSATPAVIRVAGSGFYDTTGVAVGGVACAFTYNDQNTLTVTVPSGVTGQVVVTASGVDSTDAVSYPPAS